MVLSHNQKLIGDKQIIYGVPRIGFVNKMDRAGADFFRCVEEVKERLGRNAIPLQIPIGAEDEFAGVVDLINNRGIAWNEEDQGMTWTRFQFLRIYCLPLAEWREKLVEAVAETNDELDGEVL